MYHYTHAAIFFFNVDSVEESSQLKKKIFFFFVISENFTCYLETVSYPLSPNVYRSRFPCEEISF